MTNSKLIIDLTQANAVEALEVYYNFKTQDGSKRIKTKSNQYDAQYYPMWETFQMENTKKGIMKVTVNEYAVNSDEKIATDHLWFDVEVTAEHVVAKCQASTRNVFNLM